ncbi:MAG: hypothetical protein NVS9B7_02770 [Flavisolibacter sp.]
MTTSLQHPNNHSSGQDKQTLNEDNSAPKEPSFDNPQQGVKWDNYQTRTLSSDSEGSGSKITQEEIEEALKSSEKDPSKKS